ncbi:MAG: M4 family metallopeptidase [Bacteroidales bacterium]
MKNFYSFIYLVGIVLLSQQLQAQQTEQIIKDSNQNPKLIRFDQDAKSTVTDPKQLLLSFFPEENKENFKLIRSSEDNLGITHQKFQQYYNGIKVEHATYTVHIKGNQPLSISGDYIPVKETKTQKSQITEEQALQYALDYVNAETYMWENEDNEQWAKEVEPNGTFYPEGELVYIKDYFNDDLTLKYQTVLAYKFNIYAQKPLSRAYIYVNAENGEIVFKDDIIKQLHAEKTDSKSEAFAATRYSDHQVIKTSINGSNYTLKDFSRGNGIETYNMQNGTNYFAAIDFTDNNNQWTAEEYDNSSKDNAALDAHWGTEEVWDYWMIKHGRKSFDDNGGVMKNYVHYAQNYNNAFWNGSVMTYGDGNTYDALTSLDIIAHEIGHAVCSYTADLIYAYESGAINEGFSDIWAACVEHYANENKDIWLIGEDIGGPIRSMSNPKTYGLPDTYLGTNWYSGSDDNGGVHTNNGPFSFWFYLLSEGGSGTNDNGDGYNVSAIGIEKAEKIAYRTEAVYLNADDQYADLREASILASEDLYGKESDEVQEVKNAWDAVGVYENTTGIYCSSYSNDSYFMWLREVNIGSFTNTSGRSNYSDFTAQTISLDPGEEYNINLLQSGQTSNRYQLHWVIWIDLNGDYDFNDENEEIFYGTTPFGVDNISGSFVMPNGLTDTTRMRVSIKYQGSGSKPTPCEVFTYGEVEDYTVIIGDPADSDITPPSTPSNLYLTGKTQTSVGLAWNPSSDNVGVAGYKIYKNGTEVKTVQETNTTINGLNSETSYSFYVKAYDMSDNLSSSSNTIHVTTNGSTEQDTESPSRPQNLTASDIGETSLKLTWNPSTDNVGVDRYKIYINGGTYGYVSTTSEIITGLTEGTEYYFYVRAYDAAGNSSSTSNWLWATTLSDQDNQSPSTPQNLEATEIGTDYIRLSWDESTDNRSVKHYNIYKNGAFETTSTGNSAIISNLNDGTSYNFYVNAEDEAGNISSNSNSISITTEEEETEDEEFLCNNFELTIFTDPWGNETSWEIVDNTTSLTVESGSGYASNSTITETFALIKDRSYTFTIYDSWGDGIYNDPAYVLKNGEGTVIFSENGSFGSIRSHVFTATCTFGSTITFPSYCSANGSDQTYEWIDYVGLGAIDNATGPEAGGYGNYTYLTPTLLSAHSYNIYLSAGFSDSRENEYWRVWIDFNRDGDFYDQDEMIAEGGPLAYDGVISAPFVVPTTIESGYTVMRVAMQWGDYPSSCGTFQYGEVEDYPVELSAGKTGINESEISFSNTRDIHENISVNRSQIYPNPAKDYITIDTQSRDQTLNQISIYNITGTLVKAEHDIEGNHTVDISDLPAGLYTIIIKTDRDTITKKFIKQ